MTETAPAHTEEQATNPGVRTDPTDVNARLIVIIAGGLVVAAAIVHLVSWWLFDSLKAREQTRNRSRFPLSVELRGQLPPEPRLEQIDRLSGGMGGESARRLYADEAERLESYGWVDKKAGIVHIPVDRAMKLVVEENRTRP